MDLTSSLDIIYSIGKVVAIPVAIFFVIRFINSVDTLKKRMDKILISLGSTGAACQQKHTDIEKNLEKYDKDITNLYAEQNKQGKDIAEVKGFLKMKK